MPKPVALTLTSWRSRRLHRAATSPRAARHPAPEAKPDQIPLQVRLPRSEVRAIKIAAAEREQTISEFMLACFHACMKSGKHA
jgi:hypothetical protein